MRTAMRPRYYCDFCKKASGSPSAMLKHEKGCTANPGRICSMHRKLTGESTLPSGSSLLAAFMNPALGNDWQARMKALRDEACECPGCILWTIRQSGVTHTEPTEDGWSYLPEEMSWKSPHGDHAVLGFNFKAELAEAWVCYNESKEQEQHHESWYF